MKVKIGLEIHTRLTTNSKLFCKCPTNYEEAKPNEYTCPICLGFPGSKPCVNEEALKKGLKVALALNCRINKRFFLLMMTLRFAGFYLKFWFSWIAMSALPQVEKRRWS